MQTTTLKQMPPLERAVMALILELPTEDPIDESWVGGDYAYDQDTMPWYIEISKVPGGRAGQIQGAVTVDIEVYSTEYAIADSLGSALDALLLGYPHVVEVDGRRVVLDSVFQNDGPAARPWADDSVFRIGATYSITARRH